MSTSPAPKTPGRPSFARIYFIHRRIASQGYPNASGLARELEVSLRTIERDIEYMRDLLQAPIAYDHRRRGYYYYESFNLPPINLTEGEALALFMGQRLLSQFRGTPFARVVNSALAKLQVMLPDTLTVDLEQLDQGISFAVDPARGEEDRLVAVYSDLVSAMQEQRSVEITYYTASRDRVSTRLIDPYHLRFFRGAWYVIAFCHHRREVRLFALDRILEWRVSEEGFVVSPGFSLEKYLQDSLGIERGDTVHEVAVRFDALEARWIRERQWHPSQEIEPLPDGGLILRMRLSGLDEVKRWVLGFGAHAEVLAPEELRREVAKEACRMGKVYA